METNVEETKDKEPSTQDRMDRLKEIKSNIKGGEAWLKQGHYKSKEQRWEQWKKNKEYKQCIWKDEENEFPVNTIYSNYYTVLPTLIFKAPYINVKAKKPEFVRDEANNEIQQDENGQPVIKSDNYIAARMMQVRINHEIQQIRLKDVVKRCVGDNLAPYGIGWVKIGYGDEAVYGTNNDRDNKTNYWLQRLDPRDVVFDWMATDITECRWIAHRILLPRSKVEEMGFNLPENYCSKLPEHIEDKKRQAEDPALDGVSQGSQDEIIEFWEYHDLVQKTIDWVLMDGEGHENFFMKETSEEPHPFEGSSILPLALNPDNDDIIGLSDVEPIEPQVLALNRVRKRQVHHTDNYGTGVIYEDGAVTPDAVSNYKKTPFGWLLKVKKGFFNKFKFQGTPAMGADQYNMAEIHKDEIRTTLGITDYQQGGSSSNRKATEAQIITSAASIRVEDKRHIIAGFIIEIVRRLAAMIQEFDDELDFYNVADEEFDDDFIEAVKNQYGFNPKIPFLGISRDRIQGEFDFKFNVEDIVMQPKEVRAAQLARSLQAVGSNPLFTQKFVEEYDIGKLLKEMFELNGVDIEKFNKGGPVELSAIMENEMFRKGMEVPEPHRKDDDDEHLITHGQLRRELEQSLVEYQAKIQKLQAGMQMMPEMMGADPNAQVVAQRAKEQLDAIMVEIEPIEQMLRKVKLHMQNHVESDARKAGESSMASAGGGAGMGPQPGVPPSQVAMNQPAGPPTGGQVI